MYRVVLAAACPSWRSDVDANAGPHRATGADVLNGGSHMGAVCRGAEHDRLTREEIARTLVDNERDCGVEPAKQCRLEVPG